MIALGFDVVTIASMSGRSSLGNLSPAEFERRLEQRQLQAAAF